MVSSPLPSTYAGWRGCRNGRSRRYPGRSSWSVRSCGSGLRTSNRGAGRGRTSYPRAAIDPSSAGYWQAAVFGSMASICSQLLVRPCWSTPFQVSITLSVLVLRASRSSLALSGWPEDSHLFALRSLHSACSFRASTQACGRRVSPAACAGCGDCTAADCGEGLLPQAANRAINAPVVVARRTR